MPGSPTSSRVAARQRPRSWHPTGRRQVAKQTRSLASVEAARRGARPIFGLAEALGHLEHALELWDVVPDASELVGLDLAELCSCGRPSSPARPARRRARWSSRRRAIELVGDRDCIVRRACTCSSAATSTRAAATEAALPQFERAVELVPAEPPSAERAQALAALGEGLMLAWRLRSRSRSSSRRSRSHAPSARERQSSERSRASAGTWPTSAAQGRASPVSLAGAQLAEETGHRRGLLQAYARFTDVLIMAGPAARVGGGGRARARGDPPVTGSTAPCSSRTRRGAARDRRRGTRPTDASAAALRGPSPRTSRYMLLMLRADLELGRGDFEAARMHLEAALGTTPRSTAARGPSTSSSQSWRCGSGAGRSGPGCRHALASASSRQAAQLHVWFCAKGLRAHAELAALARARRDRRRPPNWLGAADDLVDNARGVPRRRRRP